MSQKNDEETGAEDDIGGRILDAPDENHVIVEEDGHDWQYDTTSSSSLTGGFTTITNVLEGHADGPGEQYYSPSRSTFEVVDIIDGYSMPRTTSVPRSNDGNDTFDSYYNMQKNGPPLIPDLNRRTSNIMRYGWRSGGMSGLTGSSLADTTKDEGVEIGQHEQAHDDESDMNTNDIASSLSSLTNEFFPKIDRKGRFNRKGKPPSDGVVSISPTSSSPNDKSSSQSSKLFPKSLTPPRSKRRNNLVQGSPWYVNHSHSQSPQHSSSADQTPLAVHPPVVVVAPSPHNKLSDSEPSPSVISSSNISEFFSNELREMYNSSVYRSYRHRYNQVLSSPKARRITVASVLLAVIFAIVAIIAISVGARQQTRTGSDSSSASTSYYDVQINDGLPEKCCVGGYGVADREGEGIIEEDVEGDSTTALSPSASPKESSLNELEWDYVTLITPEPTPGPTPQGDPKIGSSPSTIISPNPTIKLIEWRPSILPSWQPPAEKNLPVTANPTKYPTRRPTREPTRKPTRKPTRQPTSKPTRKPTRKPSKQPTVLDTEVPTPKPTKVPTSESPTLQPSKAPVVSYPPSKLSSAPVSLLPTKLPSSSPFVSDSPTNMPTTATYSPTFEPSTSPVTIQPTTQPSTMSPTSGPSPAPQSPAPSTSKPSKSPVKTPTPAPSIKPTKVPTAKPSPKPTIEEIATPFPNPQPSPKPTNFPPTKEPTKPPSEPVSAPTAIPTPLPSPDLTPQPSLKPTKLPETADPTPKPSPEPTKPPEADPTPKPSPEPTKPPEADPTPKPSPEPTKPPEADPTPKPSPKPTKPPVTEPPVTPKPTQFRCPSDWYSVIYPENSNNKICCDEQGCTGSECIDGLTGEKITCPSL